MANNIIIASTEGTNAAAIAASATGVINPDTTNLKALGYWGAGLYYNNLLIINGHTAGIRVKIGNATQLIGAGDAYEFGAENMVFYDKIEITELGGLAQIDIDDIKYTATRIKRV